eukprot:237336-Heterocapsa_arctica.AAC.1
MQGTSGVYSLIRVDSLHFNAPLALADYKEINADNMALLCEGQEHLMYQATARSAGLVIGGEIGIQRGMATLHAPK